MYETLRILHLLALISWMAGLLYLPRLYAYHCQVAPESEAADLLCTMERRLLRIIMNPAMIATWVFGLWLAVQYGFIQQGWLHAKLVLVLILSGIHGYLASCRKGFERGENAKSERFYKILNEVPAVLMIGIVILAVAKPF